MLDKLEKGQAFIGIDGEKYYFLGFNHNEELLFTNLDLWSDKDKKYIEKSSLFVKEILEEKSDIISNSAWYFQSLQELENTSIEEKVKRCIEIIEDNNMKDFKLKPIEFGPLVRGRAYSKENNQYYEVIGFIVENDIFVNDKKVSTQKGLFSIYHSKCDDTAPMIFERACNEIDNDFYGQHFIAGNNDKVDIEDILLSKNYVNSHISSINNFLKYKNNDLEK